MSAPKRLAAATLLTILTAGAAGAQQAEEITVTAPSTGRGAPASTTILNAEDIARSGAATVGSLLDQLPAFGSQGVNAAQNDGGFGEYFIDLRNLNFDRTLVLVDGKRFVLSGIKTDEAVDLNNIPASFIDHIEILRDGSQPQYAADAVAGVVNIVLKDQIEGLHLSAYGAATGHADGGTSDISLTGGQGFAHGHVAFGLDVYQRDAVPQSARDWSAVPIASAVPGAVLFGAEATPGGHAVAPGIDALALGGGAFRPFNPLTDDYNPAPGRDLQGSLQRETAYFDADAALTDSVNADVELLYSDRTATNLDPAQMLGLTATVKHPAGFTIPDSDPYNPFGQTVTLERVVTEAGPQQTTTSGPVWRVLGGVSGTLGNDWAWTVSFDHGQSLSHYAVENDINLTRALQTAGNGPCPADQGCVEADWFGPGSLSPQALQYIRYTGRSQSDYDETVGQARLSGPLLTAPGGVARLALGAEARNEFGATSVDGVTAVMRRWRPMARWRCHWCGICRGHAVSI